MSGPARHVDDAERQRRLVRRHHLAGTGTSVHDVVRDLVAMHSSDPVTPFLALRARIAGLTVADVEQVLYVDRTLWRLHAMRRTLWVVTTDDAPAVLSGTTARVAAAERRRVHRWVAAMEDHPAADDPAAWLDGLAASVRAHLDAHGPADTRTLGQVVPGLDGRISAGAGRWAADVPVSSRLLFLMAMDGDVVRGAPAGSWRSSQYAWHAVAEWFGDEVAAAVADPPPPAPARAATARRWLHAFGPATTEDLRWWTGWTVTDTRRALAAIDAVEVTTDAGPAWLLPDDVEPEPPADGRVVTLLPGLDPTTMGWADRAFHLGPHGPALFDRNGNAGPAIWVDGRIVGGWAQADDGTIRTRLLEDVGVEVSDLVDDAAADLERWMGDDVAVIRFHTPLEVELRRD